MAIPHLFVTDLDGTLLRSNAVLSEYALATLTDLLEKGMLFTIASARSLPSIQAILRGLPLTLPIIELNGALVSDFASGKHKSVHALDRTMSERVLGLLRERGLAPFVAIAMAGQTRLYHGPLNNSAMQWYRDEKVEKGDQGLVRVDDLECAPHEATLGFTLLDRHEVLEQVVREIDRACAGRVKQYLFEHPYCHGFSELSIQDVGASKAAPIAALQDLLGATGPAALTVFGDNVNDIEMFKLAGRSVAPSNAVPAVRRIATHIVASNDDDGIVRWLHALMNEAAGSQNTSTLLFGFVDARIVGRLMLRHSLNDFLFRVGGHIGFVVVPEHRRRGYATEMLMQGLDLASSMRLEKVLVTCDEDNIASRQTIEKCGGEYEDSYLGPDAPVSTRRYWIELSKR